MVRYDPYTDSFIDNPTKEITATINLDAIPKDIIQINEVVEVSDESIEKIADAVVRKLRAEQTENSSEIPNNCEDEPQYEMGMGTLRCDNCSEYGSFKCTKCDGEMYFTRLEPKDEPQTERRE